jgi:acyl carrier protein
MVTIEEFIGKLEGEFEDIKPGSVGPDSVIKEHFTMDSINALIFIAHVNVEYDVVIDAEELVNSEKVRDLYNIVLSKMKAA